MAAEIIYLPDNNAIFFGTGRDVQLYSDGTDLVVAAGAGGGTLDIQVAVSLTSVTLTTLTATTVTVTGTLTPPNVVDNQLTPGVPVILNFAVPAAASGSTDYVIADKIEILDVLVQKRAAGGAGDELQVQTGAGAPISNTISLNITDTTLARATQINDANSTIAAGGTLRIAWTQVTDVACQVTIFGILRA